MYDDRQLGLGIIVLGLAALVTVRPLGGELGALERRCSALAHESPEVQPWRSGAPAPLPCGGTYGGGVVVRLNGLRGMCLPRCSC